MSGGSLKYIKFFGFIFLVDESVWVVGWGLDLDALVLGLQGLDGLALLGVLNAAGWDGLGLLDWLRDTVAQLVAVGLNLDDNLNLLIFANLVGLWDAALSDFYFLGCDLALWDGDLKGLGLSHNSRGGQKAGEGNELEHVEKTVFISWSVKLPTTLIVR